MAHRSKSAAEQAYRTIGAKARETATVRLRSLVGSEADMRPIDATALAAWQSQWHPFNDRFPPDGGWDWPQVFERYRREVKRFDVSVWHADRLCGLSIGKFASTAVQLDVIEGAPTPDHPLKGNILPLILEATANAAQLSGRREIKLMEPTKGMIERYITTFGFRLEVPRGGKTYCVRSV